MNNTIRVCVLGDTCVGKTSLLKRICENKFSTNEAPTIGLYIFFKKIMIKNVAVTFQFWDTAGIERFRLYNQSFYKNSDIVMLVFDVTNRQTFLKLNDILYDVRKERCSNIPIILIGSKGDTLNREVSKDEINAFCSQTMWCIFYAELSAKEGFDSERMLEYIYHEASMAERLRDVVTLQSHEESTIPQITRDISSNCLIQ